MKKLILFLLLSIAGYGQTSNGQEQEFDYGIKNNSTQTITTPPYLTTTGMDGTQGKIPSALIEKTDNKQNSLAGDGTGTKYPTVDAVNLSTVTKIPQNQVTWGNKLMILCGDSTTWQMTATGIGFDYMTAFYRLPGNKMEKITGYVNFGSSGYTLNGFFNGAVATPPAINTTTNLGIGSWDYYGHNIQTAISQKTAIEYRKSIPSQEVVWVLCYGINDCILNASVGNQTQAQITAYLANILNQAVLKFKQEFPKDQVILRIPNTMATRPYNAGAGFPSPTEYPTFGTDKPTDVALVTKWNIAIRDAYFLVSQQNLNTILLDTHEKIFGSESAEIDANFRPFMTDLVHPSGLGYNAIADELAYIFTDERKQTNFSRLDEATKRAVLLSNQPYDNYSDYVSDVTKYKMVFNTKLTSTAGPSYIDIRVSKTIFDATLLGAPFYIKKGNVTIKIASYSTTANGSNCRILGVAPSAEFQAETGSTSIYVDQPNNADNLHKTGNETFTGIKSVTSTGATNVNGFNITSNGTGTTSPLNITSPSTSTGRAINITQSGNLGSKAIYLFNNSTLGADGVVIEHTGTGRAMLLNSLTGSTGDLLNIRKNNIETFTFNQNGSPFWKETPLNASGTYDIVVRRSNLDANIGRFEVVPSITFATIASPAFTGTPTAPTAALGTNTTQIATTAFVASNFSPVSGSANYIQNQNDSAQSANMWISGRGTFGNEVLVTTRLRINHTTRNNQLFGDGSAFSVGGTNNLGIRNDDGNLLFASGSNVPSFTLETTGAATFSSTVTATSFNGSATLTGTPTAPTAAPGTTGNQIATLDYVLANSGATSGTYTPTYTATENISSITHQHAKYTVVGKIVTIDIVANVFLTVMTNASLLRFTLPVSLPIKSGEKGVFSGNVVGVTGPLVSPATSLNSYASSVDIAFRAPTGSNTMVTLSGILRYEIN